MIDEFKIKEHYQKQNTSDSNERWQNIEELINGMIDYDSEKEDANLTIFLEEVSLLTDIDKWNDKNEKETFMQDIGLNKTGLNQLIKEGYELLNLDTFFTSGPEESRAWTVEKNTLAPKAASVIHTDFEKNFIRAEAVTCEDFIKFGSAEKCKENGKLRIEGKDYIVKDGDVLYFRVNP